MELDLEPLTILWTFVMTAAFEGGLWFIRFGEGGLDLRTRLAASVLAPFIIYVIIVVMKNK